MSEDSTLTKKKNLTNLDSFIARLIDATRQAAMTSREIELAPSLPALFVPGTRYNREYLPQQSSPFAEAAITSMDLHSMFDSCETCITDHIPNPHRLGLDQNGMLAIRINPLLWREENVDTLIWLKAELRAQGFDRSPAENDIRLDVETFATNFHILRQYLLDFPELSVEAREEMEDTLEYALYACERTLASTPSSPQATLLSTVAKCPYLN